MQFDKSLIKILLARFEPNAENYTHHFVNCCSSFCGSDSMPLIRKYLHYLKDKGYVVQHKHPYNIHKWSITNDGLEALALFNSDQFIK